MIRQVKSKISIPLTALGGVGELGHISEIVKQEGIVGAGAGSFFVFKGKYRAVLISYPSLAEKYSCFGH